MTWLLLLIPVAPFVVSLVVLWFSCEPGTAEQFLDEGSWP